MSSISGDKETSGTVPQYNEDLEPANTHATYYLNDEFNALSDEHRHNLLQHHGTLELDPVTTMSDADPYNWPKWKKTASLVLVAFHACMSTFTAAAIIPAYQIIGVDLGVTVPQASYLTSPQIAIFGGAPLLWRPLSTRYGRRPIFLISLIGSCVFNFACAKTKTYGAIAACRALTAFFICPAAAIGSAVVVETFFKNETA